MASYDKSYPSVPCHGGRIRRTTAGRFVAERSDSGRIRRATFDTEEGAKTHLRELGVRRDKQGVIATALSSHQTRDAIDALHRMKQADINASLCAAADFYILHHRPGIINWTFKEALALYIAELETPTDGGHAASPETVKSKKNRLKTFSESYGRKPLRELTTDDVQAWVDSFGTIAPRTVLNRKAELQSVLNFAAARMEDFENKICKVKQRRKKGDGNVGILKADQAEAILRYMETNYPTRYAVTMAILMFAGIRPAELLRPGSKMTWSQIRLDERIIFLPASETKTRDFREVPIEENLYRWLVAYQEHGRISPSESRFREARTSAVKAAGMKAWPADGARHTYATAAGELHGFHKTAERMGHVGGLRVFLSHYRGRMTKAEATRYFQILPVNSESNVIPFASAT